MLRGSEAPRLRLAPAMGLHVSVCGQDREREAASVCVLMHVCVCLVALPHFLHLLIMDSP